MIFGFIILCISQLIQANGWVSSLTCIGNPLFALSGIYSMFIFCISDKYKKKKLYSEEHFLIFFCPVSGCDGGNRTSNKEE